MSRFLPRPAPLALAISLAFSAGAVFAQSAPPSAVTEAAREISISAQPLGDALNAWARQTRMQVAVQQSLVAGKTAPAVSGNLTPRQALTRLLAGSGLDASINGAEAIVRPAAPSSAATLADVLVTGKAERADGLPSTYAGGQVARGGRLGMLGNVDVMDTPFNITNYTSQLIEDQQAATVLEVLKNDPAVRQSAPTANLSASSFNIRGFSLSADSVTFDGLHGMAPGNGDLSIEFAERVEVLKGPAALLYGMSPGGTVGGSVNVVPKRAGDTPLTRLTLGVESDALWRTQVDTGSRFGANNEWGLRFNGRYKGGDIFIDGAKNEGTLGATALDYRGERLRVTLDAYRLQEKQKGGGTLSAVLSNWGGEPSWLSSMPPAPSARTNLYRGAPQTKETTDAVIVGAEYDFNDSWTGFAKFGVQRDRSTGPAFAFVDNVQANGDAVLSTDDWPSLNKTKSAEIGLRGRFQTGPVSHALALSVSHLNRTNDSAVAFGETSQFTNIYRPAPIMEWVVPPARVPRSSETTLGGVALADTLGFIDDRVLLTLGVRRQNVKATNFDETTGAVTSAYDASAWTPMAGLVVKPTENLSLYANYIQGLSQGSTVSSRFQNAGEVFPPYKTRQIEVGAKLQTGNFTNTISVFQITRPSTTADNSTSPLPTQRLNGEQRNRGIEWAIFGELTKDLRMLGGVTYLQARLTKTEDGLQDGNKASGSPPWAANLGLDWDVPGVPGLAVNGRVIYTSAQYVDTGNSLKMPSWTILDLGARYATKIGGKSVVFRAGVDNVFDRRYWQGVFFNGTVSVGAPRTYRVSAAIDF